MDKRVILLTGMVLILFLTLVMAMGDFSFTGRSIGAESYSYTKAICNSNNECIDVLIECVKGKVESIEPVSDLVRFDEEWQDFREAKELC